MEGQKVGSAGIPAGQNRPIASATAEQDRPIANAMANQSRPIANATANQDHPFVNAAIPDTDNLSQTRPHDRSTTDLDEFQLLWPVNLISELALERRHRPWSTPLAIVGLILASLAILAIGPMQLLLLVVTQDYNFATETYFPIASRISLLLSGLLAILTIVAMIRAWREQPLHGAMTITAGAGTIVLSAFVWLNSFILHLQPNQIAFIALALLIIAWLAVGVTHGRLFSTDHPQRPFELALASVALLALVEVGLTSTYLFSQTSQVEESQLALEALGEAQTAARIGEITPELSDLVYTLCQGSYDPVYILNGSTDTGLFECRDSHEVYSVSGPNDPVTSSSSTVIGSAFYFGTTDSPLIAAYFPPESGSKYLYRDLSGAELPSELVLLLPADSEESLIVNYLDPLTNLINELTAGNSLTLSIFYSSELNTVVSTQDFILIAAVDTLTMTSWLPHGTNLQGYLNGRYGSYLYTLDSRLYALNELAASPLLYSSQTRDAINARRHITATFESGRAYTADEVRDILWNNFIDPTP